MTKQSRREGNNNKNKNDVINCLIIKRWKEKEDSISTSKEIAKFTRYLLTNGDEESTSFESTTSKIIWMIFLMALFYLSLEIFMKFTKDGSFGDGGKQEF